MNFVFIFMHLNFSDAEESNNENQEIISKSISKIIAIDNSVKIRI